MANIFPRSINWLPLQILICVGLLGAVAPVVIWHYFTPKYTRVGFEPSQPVPFDHSLHVTQVGLDCRYCHNQVEVSSHSNVPSNATCYNCHGNGVAMESPKLANVRAAGTDGTPIKWRRVHALPDYAYFNHAVHVNRGVSCQSCHGNVNEMEVVRHDQPLSMGWCLDCHRNPEDKLRPLDKITDFQYDPAETNRSDFYKGLLEDGVEPASILAVIEDKPESEMAEIIKATEGDKVLDRLLAAATDEFGDTVEQQEIGLQLKKHWQVSPPESCAACHR